MRIVNVTMDLYGSVICLIIFIYLLTGGRWGQRINQSFAIVCLGNIFMQIGDMTNWLCEGYRNPWNPVLLQVGTFLYYLSAVPMLLFFTVYMIEYLKFKVKVSSRFLWIVFGFGAVDILCVVLSPFLNIFYQIGEGNIYQRGDAFWLSQVIPFIIYSVDMWIIFCYRKYMSVKELLLLSSYIIFPGIAEVIQIQFYGIALLNTGITVSLLLIFVNLQSERELVMRRQQVELSEARIDIMLCQINPHFLYNTLTTIRHLCSVDPVQAKKAILDFSQFLRANMKFLTSKALISFEQELIHVKNYLNLEQQRFGERLKVRYKIEVTDFVMPPLCLQPLVENAVRHGITKREEGGTVTITSEENEKEYHITVMDDGVGFSPEHSCADGREHVGISNVRKRLKELSHGEVKIESCSGRGTRVTIVIPKEER